MCQVDILTFKPTADKKKLLNVKLYDMAGSTLIFYYLE